MDTAKDQPTHGERETAGDPPRALERRGLAGPRDLAFDGGPEQLEDLGDDDHGRRPVVADRFEDHPWVAAPDVEDVGTDVERVEERDCLLQQMR